MRRVLTRLTMLLGASLMLCVSSGSGVALAGSPPARWQYQEIIPGIHHPKRSSGAAKRHTSTTKSHTSTTSTTAVETPSPPVNEEPTTTVSSPTRHRTARKHHRLRHRHTNKSVKRHVTPKPPTMRRTHVLSARPSHGATGLTAAAATGSGGGSGVWLLVILIVVLVSGSAAGILRYRHTR